MSEGKLKPLPWPPPCITSSRSRWVFLILSIFGSPSVGSLEAKIRPLRSDATAPTKGPGVCPVTIGKDAVGLMSYLGLPVRLEVQF